MFAYQTFEYTFLDITMEQSTNGIKVATNLPPPFTMAFFRSVICEKNHSVLDVTTIF